MSAPTHTPTNARLRVQTRLPWWAVALPALAFAALLTLIVSPADAHAAAGPGTAVAQVLELIRDVLLRIRL